MEVVFERKYPDFSLWPECIPHIKRNTFRNPLALFLAELPPNSFVVYSGAERGEGLEILEHFFLPHRLLVIDNYWHGRNMEFKEPLMRVIKNLSNKMDLTFAEVDFDNVVKHLSNVDLLLLDGPPLTTDYSIFSDEFLCVMHDVGMRIRETEVAKFEPLIPYICRIDDWQVFEDPKFRSLPYEARELLFTPKCANWYKYGCHGWLYGRKEQNL